MDSVDRLVEARNLRIKELVSEVNYLKNDYKTMNNSLEKTTREITTLKEENDVLSNAFYDGNLDGLAYEAEIEKLKEALNLINDLAPAMHQYSKLEYGMVMIAREALK